MLRIAIVDAAEQGSSPTRKRKSFNEGMDRAVADEDSPQPHLERAATTTNSPPKESDSSTNASKTGWTEEEDAIVQAAVRTLGTQWQLVANRLPGRTADAVRNRWHRLAKRNPAGQQAAEEAAEGCKPLLVPERSRSFHGDLASTEPTCPADVTAVVLGSDHGRSRWSESEDRTIEEGVRMHGCRWRQIAAMLPGRSDSSIRNRWQRLARIGSYESPSVAAPLTEPSMAPVPTAPIPMPAGADSVGCTSGVPSGAEECSNSSTPSSASASPAPSFLHPPLHPDRTHSAPSPTPALPRLPDAKPFRPEPPPRVAPLTLASSATNELATKAVAELPVAPDRSLALALVAFASQNLPREEDARSTGASTTEAFACGAES